MNRSSPEKSISPLLAAIIVHPGRCDDLLNHASPQHINELIRDLPARIDDLSIDLIERVVRAPSVRVHVMPDVLHASFLDLMQLCLTQESKAQSSKSNSASNDQKTKNVNALAIMVAGLKPNFKELFSFFFQNKNPDARLVEAFEGGLSSVMSKASHPDQLIMAKQWWETTQSRTSLMRLVIADARFGQGAPMAPVLKNQHDRLEYVDESSNCRMVFDRNVAHNFLSAHPKAIARLSQTQPDMMDFWVQSTVRFIREFSTGNNQAMKERFMGPAWQTIFENVWPHLTPQQQKEFYGGLSDDHDILPKSIHADVSRKNITEELGDVINFKSKRSPLKM